MRAMHKMSNATRSYSDWVDVWLLQTSKVNLCKQLHSVWNFFHRSFPFSEHCQVVLLIHFLTYKCISNRCFEMIHQMLWCISASIENTEMLNRRKEKNNRSFHIQTCSRWIRSYESNVWNAWVNTFILIILICFVCLWTEIELNNHLNVPTVARLNSLLTFIYLFSYGKKFDAGRLSVGRKPQTHIQTNVCGLDEHEKSKCNHEH